MPDDQEPLEDDLETLRAALAASEARNAAIEREATMLRAGVDLESKTGQMFAKAYDGDLDVEKIKADATEIVGALKAAPAVETGEEVVREEGEENQLAERTALTSGDAAGQEDPDPGKQIWGALDEEIANGARVEDAASGALRNLVERANNGDQRVLASKASE